MIGPEWLILAVALALIGPGVAWYLWYPVGYTVLCCLALVNRHSMWVNPGWVLRRVFWDWPREGIRDARLGGLMEYEYGAWIWRPPFHYRRVGGKR